MQWITGSETTQITEAFCAQDLANFGINKLITRLLLFNMTLWSFFQVSKSTENLSAFTKVTSKKRRNRGGGNPSDHPALSSSQSVGHAASAAPPMSQQQLQRSSSQRQHEQLSRQLPSQVNSTKKLIIRFQELLTTTLKGQLIFPSPSRAECEPLEHSWGFRWCSC